MKYHVEKASNKLWIRFFLVANMFLQNQKWLYNVLYSLKILFEGAKKWEELMKLGRKYAEGIKKSNAAYFE